MTSPISRISSLTIGTVESVAPDEIKVLLDIDSPRNTALNTGVPTPFPRINSFVLLPNESGAVVGVVVWLGVERSAYPKRQGLKDFGLIDLPFPLRKMAVCPIGTLVSEKSQWRLERGVQSYPSVGDAVILPTREQTVSIVTGKGTDSRVTLGTCPIAHGAPIAVDPDKLFGRHLAILGNTGSGKSCTLAALIRSTIESALAAMNKSKNKKCDMQAKESKPHLNARFIILDPNGEYSKCFQDLGTGCRVFQVPPLTNEEEIEFTLPAWMWNSSEWAAVAQAAPRTQRPILQEALRNLKTGSGSHLDMFIDLRAKLSQALLVIGGSARIGTSSARESNPIGNYLEMFKLDIIDFSKNAEDDLSLNLVELSEHVQDLLQNKRWGQGQYNSFSMVELQDIVSKINQVRNSLGQNTSNIVSEDAPIPYDPKILAKQVEDLADLQGGNAASFISTLAMRIRTFLSDTRIKDVIAPRRSITLSKWLSNSIGADGGANGSVAVIDLSLVPYEILHLVMAVSTRLILESLQRYRKLNHENLPTVLVLEEAHTFVAKRLQHGDEIPSPADMCRSIFERVAREGRKFGLGLVLSSQRPSDLSETVLSQCNSFLLHRITNDRDQELIARLVPDNTRGLLRELPSLPTRHCILLGSASKVPTLIEVTNLECHQRPESDDPDFWKVWTNESPRPINWDEITRDWTGEGSAK